MSAAIPLRDDFDGPALRALGKASKDANQTRRLLSLAVIYEGGSRGEAWRRWASDRPRLGSAFQRRGPRGSD